MIYLFSSLVSKLFRLQRGAVFPVARVCQHPYNPHPRLLSGYSVPGIRLQVWRHVMHSSATTGYLWRRVMHSSATTGHLWRHEMHSSATTGYLWRHLMHSSATTGYLWRHVIHSSATTGYLWRHVMHSSAKTGCLASNMIGCVSIF